MFLLEIQLILLEIFTRFYLKIYCIGCSATGSQYKANKNVTPQVTGPVSGINIYLQYHYCYVVTFK